MKQWLRSLPCEEGAGRGHESPLVWSCPGLYFWEQCGDAEQSPRVVLLLAALLEDAVAVQASFCRRPPCWGGRRVGKGRLDLRCFMFCFNRSWSLRGRVSPSRGRILGSCLNQASLSARAGPLHAVLFLVMGLCQQRLPRGEVG